MSEKPLKDELDANDSPNHQQKLSDEELNGINGGTVEPEKRFTPPENPVGMF
jgi:hypothetical protein